MRVLYTVLADKEGLPVRYFDWRLWKAVFLHGPFKTIGEAKQAITSTASQYYPGYEVYELTAAQFTSKLRSLAHLKKEKARILTSLQQNKGQQHQTDPSIRSR